MYIILHCNYVFIINYSDFSRFYVGSTNSALGGPDHSSTVKNTPPTVTIKVLQHDAYFCELNYSYSPTSLFPFYFSFFHSFFIFTVTKNITFVKNKTNTI